MVRSLYDRRWESRVLRDQSIVVLGCGRVGSAVATLLGAAGVRIAAVTTSSATTAEKAASRTGAPAGTDNAAAATQGDIVLITTNDDSIAHVAAEVAEAGALRPGQLVVHMSGALRLAVLEPAAQCGAVIGCAHPMQSFATAEDAARRMQGSVFGVTPGPGAAGRLRELVEGLGGEAVIVADEDKVVYHAAAVMASNYLVALEDAAVGLLGHAGFDRGEALDALRPLVSGTWSNIRALGTTDALTGPIVRGDVDTVREHIGALSELPGDELALYRALGRHALEIARRRGTLSAAGDEALGKLLSD